MGKTFYLLDLANTLFPEKWDVQKSGVPSFEAYVESLGYDLKTISPHDYEWCYERPYKVGLFNVTIADGFREVLSWTKYNGVFTTGNREQVDWRAEQLQKKYGFDIRDYVGEIQSTFDYGNTNVKTQEMLEDIFKKKQSEGFEIVVYIDDKEKNCEIFLSAIEQVRKKGTPVRARAYHIMNDNEGVRIVRPDYIKVGTLFDIKEFEQKFV